ncbi:MAG: tetratricopeptide repeat protein [Cytophagales bacterium]|nr:tetratricopeptide repeat protein [Cytophagales bacterium]
MRKSFSKIVVCGLTILSFFLSVPVWAQKKKKKKDKFKIEKPMVHSKNLEAEYYFAEGQKYFILEEYDKALEYFQASLELKPKNAAIFFKLAQIKHHEGQMEVSRKYYEQAISINPKNKFYYTHLASLLTSQEKMREAMSVYEKLTSLPDAKEYLYELAAIQMYLKLWDKALASFDKIEEIFGFNPKVIGEKQKIYLRLNDLENAVELGKDLLKKEPSNEDYAVRLAELYLSNNKTSEGIACLESFIKNYPNSPQASLILADIYNRKGKKEKANELLKTALKSKKLSLSAKVQYIASLFPNLTNQKVQDEARALVQLLLEAHPEEGDAYSLAGDLEYASKRNNQALAYYDKALEYNQENLNIWQNVIGILLNQKKYKQAGKYAEKALEFFPNQAVLYYFCGASYLMDKAYAKAIHFLKSGIRLAKNNDALLGDMQGQLGDAYNSLKQYEKSDEAYDKALKLDPNSEHVLNNYSYFLSLRKEKLSKANEMSKRLVEMHPNDATYLDTHAWVLYQLGHYKMAKKYLEKAISFKPSGVIVEHYGDVLYQLGDVEGAVNQWKKAKLTDSETSDKIDKKIADRKLYE